MLDGLSDEQLVDHVNQGRDADHAFAALYHRHKQWVMNLAMRFTRDRDLAADVTQEVFIYLLGKFPGFTLTAKLTTFLYPAVKNLSITHRDKARRHQGGDEAVQGESGDIARDAAADNAHSRAELEHVLDGLSEPHREVVLMRFVDDMALAEIAAALDVPVGTVKSRLHHAIKALRDDPRLKKYFDL